MTQASTLAANAPEVTVKMSKLILNADGQHLPINRGRRKEKVTSVVVEVDMLDSEKTPQRTAAITLGRTGKMSLSFDKVYDATPESKLAKKFVAAQKFAAVRVHGKHPLIKVSLLNTGSPGSQYDRATRE